MTDNEQTNATDENAFDATPPAEETPREDPSSPASDAAGALDESEDAGNAPPAEPEAPDPLEARLAALEARSRELEMENGYLRGAISQRQPAEPEAPPTPEELDEAALLRGLQNPATTVATLRKFVDHTADRLRQELSSQVRETSELTDSLAKDREMAVARYPEITTNAEFGQLATQIHQSMTQAAGRKFPGSLTLAAGYARAELARLGKMPPLGAPAAAATPTQPRSNVRRINTPLVRGSGQPPGGGGTKDPLAGWSKEDREAAQKTADKFGITLEDFARNFNEAKKGSSNYGVG